MWHVWGKGVVRAGFWWGDPKEVDHLQDLSLDGKIILKKDSQEIERGRIDWIGLMMLRIGTGGGHL
jgi:hypothetical protein